MKGRDCDNCGRHLKEDEFDEYGSWSYACEKCGFRYRHDLSLTPKEQIEKLYYKVILLTERRNK